MRKLVFLALVLTVIVAGCVGSKTTVTPQSAIPTGDVNAASAGAGNIDSGIQGIESMNTELESGISDADLNLGI